MAANAIKGLEEIICDAGMNDYMEAKNGKF